MMQIHDFKFLSTTSLALLALLSVTVFIVRLTTSPLRKIPGPFLAGITGYWIWILDLLGLSNDTIRDLHTEYGNLVRIGPNEVSVNDIGIYTHTLYKQASPYLKEPDFYEAFTAPGGHLDIFTTADPKSHSVFRRSMASSFSRRSILNIEDEIWRKAEEMSTTLKRAITESPGTSVNIGKMFRCFALDVVSSFSFGKSMDSLEKPNFEDEVIRAFDYVDENNTLFRGSQRLRTFLLPLLAILPLERFQSSIRMFIRVDQHLQKTNELENGSRSMLKEMAESGARMESHLDFLSTPQYIRELGMGFIFAGTDTTATSLTLGAWSILSDARIMNRLNLELQTIWKADSSHPSLTELERLPYLQACVKETLRFSTAVPGRLPRIVPKGGLIFERHHIPAGTIISSSAWLMHHNESVFPNSFSFDPQRWLIEDEILLHERHRYLVPFSEGSRKCIGINLAQAEIYIGLAILFRFYKPVQVESAVKAKRNLTTSIPAGVRVVLETNGQ